MAGNTVISATLSAHCISMHECFLWNVRVVWFYRILSPATALSPSDFPLYN
ncbi:MAG: hypothetical protein IT283_02295 [Bacteroidetes bacterium]|nr:hypothetical protein [Bacteroidota bacterium]MCZ2355970.1 hypothetical protein [Bacteroidia bacterium]